VHPVPAQEPDLAAPAQAFRVPAQEPGRVAPAPEPAGPARVPDLAVRASVFPVPAQEPDPVEPARARAASASERRSAEIHVLDEDLGDAGVLVGFCLKGEN
jgi:hypothetical protein